MINKLLKAVHNIALSLKGALGLPRWQSARSFRNGATDGGMEQGDASLNMLNAETASPEKPITTDYDTAGSGLGPCYEKAVSDPLAAALAVIAREAAGIKVAGAKNKRTRGATIILDVAPHHVYRIDDGVPEWEEGKLISVTRSTMSDSISWVAAGLEGETLAAPLGSGVGVGSGEGSEVAGAIIDQISNDGLTLDQFAELNRAYIRKYAAEQSESEKEESRRRQIQLIEQYGDASPYALFD